VPIAGSVRSTSLHIGCSWLDAEGKSLLDPLGRCVGDCRGAVDFTWRLVVGFGAIPAILALFLRLHIPETPRYTLEVSDDPTEAELLIDDMFPMEKDLAERPKLTASTLARHHTADRGANRLTSFCGGLIEFFYRREYLWHIIGTSLSWFLVDFAFYGLGLNNSRVMSSIWPRNEDIGTSVHSVITRTASHYMLTGAMATAIGGMITLFNIERLGGRKVQMIGFFWLCVLFLVLGVVSLHLPGTHHSTLVVGLYILCQIFFNFGKFPRRARP
jgi:MFS transporter, PHS family, inorganic phosphate transporter